MGVIAPKPDPNTAGETKRMLTSILIIKLVEHQEVHRGYDCEYCRPWRSEIDRRLPPSEIL